MVKLNQFGNIGLFVERSENKTITLNEYKKILERTGGILNETNLDDTIHKIHYMNYIIENSVGRQIVGYSYDIGCTHKNRVDEAPNFLGKILKIESLPVNEQEIRAKITSDIFYTSYFVESNKLSLAGIREFYEAFKLALDSRQLKVLKEYVKKNTPQHCDVNYTDLRLIILSYYCVAMGLDVDLDCAVKYGPKLGYMVISGMLDKVNYDRFVSKARLDKLFNQK